MDFKTYFQDELNDGETTVEEVLKLYNWPEKFKCPYCGREVLTIEAVFDPDYDIAFCKECGEDE